MIKTLSFFKNLFSILCFLVLSLQLNAQTHAEINDISTYVRKVDSLIKEKKYDASISILKREIITNRKTKNWKNLASLYNKLSLCYYGVKKLDEARNTAQRALDLSTNKQRPDPIEEANANINLGIYYNEKSEYDKAQKYYENALKIQSNFFPDEHEKIAKSHLRIGLVLSIKNRYKEALKHIDDAKVLFEKDKKPNLSYLGDCYAADAKITHSLGDYSKALKKYQSLLDIILNLPVVDYDRIADTYGNIGATYYMLLDYKNAETNLKQGLKIYKENIGENNVKVANIYRNLARVYSRLGEFDLALDYNKKDISISKKNHSEKHAEVGQAYRSMALTYSRMKDFENELKYNLKTVNNLIGNFGEQHKDIAIIYSNMGRTYRIQHKNELSLKYFKKAIKIGTAIFGEEHINLANYYHNLGYTYANLNNNESAIYHFKKALEIRKKNYGKKHRGIGNNYLGLGFFYEGIKDYENAIKYYQYALDMYKDEFSDALNSELTQVNYDELSIILDAIDGVANVSRLKYIENKNIENLQASKLAYEKADIISKKARESITAYSNKIRLAGTNEYVLKGALETSFLLSSEKDEKQNLEKAFYYSERSRASTLQEILERNSAKNTKAAIKTSLELEKQLRNDRGLYLSKIQNEQNKKNNVDLNKIKNYEDELFKNNQKHDSVLQYIKEKHPHFFKTEYNNALITIAEIQAQLSEQTSLVQYFDKDSTVFAFVISKNYFNVKELKTTKLAEEIDTFRLRINEKNIVQFKETAYRLYQTLVTPIVNELQGDELIIIPDGPIWNLNFELLLTQQTQSNNPKELPYLLSDYAISYANSANLLFNPVNNTTETLKECLAFSFSDSGSMTSENTMSLAALRDAGEDLPGTRKEIREISKILDGKYFFGKEAIESNFKEKASNYAILHLALHGEVDHKNPENSKLYFTQNKDTLEDNFLYAHELFTLNIPTELTVLSACNTGTGKVVTGEGIMSLGNAFQYAGSKSLLMTSWEVSDDVAPQLMKFFYQNLKDGMNKSKALQQAKLTYLKHADLNRANPFYWGSFYLVGETSAIDFNESNVWVYTLLGALLTLLIFLIGRRILKHGA